MTGKRSTTYQNGDVVLVPFPFTNQRTRKVRPAVVLSSDAYHDTEPDLILGALTANLAAATAPVDYVLVEWQQANPKLAFRIHAVAVLVGTFFDCAQSGKTECRGFGRR